MGGKGVHSWCTSVVNTGSRTKTQKACTFIANDRRDRKMDFGCDWKIDIRWSFATGSEGSWTRTNEFWHFLKQGNADRCPVYFCATFHIRRKTYGKINKTQQNWTKRNKANKTSFLRGYNIYTRKQENVSFVGFLQMIRKFCCGFVGFCWVNKTATKFCSF